MAVLMAMHDLNLVSLSADRVALLVGGQLVQVGTPGEVLNGGVISSAYQTSVEVISHPDSGIPFIFPRAMK